MAKVSILIAFLTHFLCALGQKQLSQCSEYFTHVTKPGTIDMVGQIEIPPPSANDMFYLKVALSITTKLGQVVRLELARSIKESVRHVHQGRPLLYYVYYPMNEQIPSLSAIWFNSQRYCPDPEVSENITANVELGHILSAPNGEPLMYGQEISQPYHRNSSNYRIDNPSYDRLNHYQALNNECGITSYYTDDTNRQIADGETTLPGQWPWVVAIYVQYTNNETEHRFKCTGSILTTRHVITNVRCVTIWRYSLKKHVLINPQRIYVSFGQLILRKWDGNHTEIINRVVVDYKTSSEDLARIDNLAILILKTAVEFNAFIKPICLWSGSTNLQDTVNMTGYIVGWGFNSTEDESGNVHLRVYNEETRMGKMPLTNLSVDHNVENILYYTRYYSGTEFPCYADIGSGIMIFNITTGRYHLRGIKYGCTQDKTTYFSDVAKLMSWIRQQILFT